MIDPQLLAILVCPETHTPLRVADASLLARLNERVTEGTLTTRLGEPVQRPIAGGLVRQDGTLLFPIVDDIAVMLLDEAIPLEPDRVDRP